MKQLLTQFKFENPNNDEVSIHMAKSFAYDREIEEQIVSLLNMNTLYKTGIQNNNKYTQNLKQIISNALDERFNFTWLVFITQLQQILHGNHEGKMGSIIAEMVQYIKQIIGSTRREYSIINNGEILKSIRKSTQTMN